MASVYDPIQFMAVSNSPYINSDEHFQQQQDRRAERIPFSVSEGGYGERTR
jgi:hypothetical protein